MAKRKATRPPDEDAGSEFEFDRLKPKIERILATDLRTEEARQASAKFVFETLSEMNADIEKVSDAAGDYPDGVISGDVWITGADYASCAESLTHHFAKSGWLKHEANASWLWVQATLAVCSHYHDMVGPAMNAAADCCRRVGDIERAIQMWSGVVMDFASLLDGYDDDPEGIYESERVAIESLREACVALQASGHATVDSFDLDELIVKADGILARPTLTEDEDEDE